MKQKRHIRRYKSGKERVINPRNFSMYPLGRKDLKIIWDKDKLQKYYEDEKFGMGDMIKLPDIPDASIKETNPSLYEENINKYLKLKTDAMRKEEETMYMRHAKGIEYFDENKKEKVAKKIPYSQLPAEAKMEINLIKGGFIHPETDKISSSHKMRRR